MADTNELRGNRGATEQRPTGGQVLNGRNNASGGSWWAIEPDVGRVAHGIPKRVDRLRGLGNAIVPQVAEVIFRAIDQAR